MPDATDAQFMSRHTPPAASNSVPLPSSRRVAWFSARARNALRRPARLWTVAGVVFMVVTLTLILVPRQAQRAFAALVPRADEWRDSTAALAALTRAEAELETARTAFLAARAEAMAPPPLQAAPQQQLTFAQLRQRDSLQGVVAVIRRELARVERSPLPASYRQLAGLPEMSGEPRLRPLLDSLAAVEREREEFAALGGVDPIYVSLTTRVNAIGRTIQGLAERRAAEATRAITALEPAPLPAPIAVDRPPVDTMTPLRRLVGAEQAHHSARNGLATVRQTNAELVKRAEMARQGANFIAPPVAVLGAAIVVAVVVGYLWVLVGELRHPRVADSIEVERETGLRTIGVVVPDERQPDRARRSTDRRLSEILDPLADAYRVLYLHLSPTGGALPVVTVTGEEPAVVATVAVNLAAAAAAEARGALLIDADLTNGPISRALRVRSSPGVTELLLDRATWTGAVVSAISGRDRAVDVIPAGTRWRDHPPVASDEFRREMQRMARRYDVTVISAPLKVVIAGSDGLVPAPDVVLTARTSFTPLGALREAVEAMSGAGMRVQGVMLWDGDAPTV